MVSLHRRLSSQLKQEWFKGHPIPYFIPQWIIWQDVTKAAQFKRAISVWTQKQDQWQPLAKMHLFFTQSTHPFVMDPNYVWRADRRFINEKGESDWPPSNTTDTTNYVEMYLNNASAFVKNKKRRSKKNSWGITNNKMSWNCEVK